VTGPNHITIRRYGDMAKNHSTTHESLEEILDTILEPMETFIAALVNRAKNENYPYLLKILVTRLRTDLEKVEEICRRSMGGGIIIEVAESGEYIRAFVEPPGA
jgi:hypothetical protein